ncbi:zinc ribbon domain-containing protein [Halopiger goleimassiliensis]|uniref:zinc ribbon domain-containing protein n=1 Tax=Halopiger goleimassiliensis TaxID=1293048 RepID=UPI0006782FF2
MPVHYYQTCGAELDDNASYCPECGTVVRDGHNIDAGDDTTSKDSDPWDWSDPRAPVQSPRHVVGSLNLLGFVSFLLAIGLNAVGLPITALPHPIPIALFAF